MNVSQPTSVKLVVQTPFIVQNASLADNPETPEETKAKKINNFLQEAGEYEKIGEFEKAAKIYGDLIKEYYCGGAAYALAILLKGGKVNPQNSHDADDYMALAVDLENADAINYLEEIKLTEERKEIPSSTRYSFHPDCNACPTNTTKVAVIKSPKHVTK